eukprot:COSAG01_NODE_3391_length_6151_cov_4.717944_5_plen_63_part_00
MGRCVWESQSLPWFSSRNTTQEGGLRLAASAGLLDDVNLLLKRGRSPMDESEGFGALALASS